MVDNNPVNDTDPFGLTNQPGDFGWSWYSIPISALTPANQTALGLNPPDFSDYFKMPAGPIQIPLSSQLSKPQGKYPPDVLTAPSADPSSYDGLLLGSSGLVGTPMGEQMAALNSTLVSSFLPLGCPAKAAKAPETVLDLARSLLSGPQKEAFQQVTRFAEGVRTGNANLVYDELATLAQTQAGRQQLLEIHQAVSSLIPMAKSGEPASILINLQQVTGALARGGR